MPASPLPVPEVAGRCSRCGADVVFRFPHKEISVRFSYNLDGRLHLDTCAAASPMSRGSFRPPKGSTRQATLRGPR